MPLYDRQFFSQGTVQRRKTVFALHTNDESRLSDYHNEVSESTGKIIRKRIP